MILGSAFVWFSVFIILTPPAWKAPGLVKGLREADRVVERAKLPASLFDNVSSASVIMISPAAQPKPQLTQLLEGLKSSSLCTVPHQGSVSVTGIITEDDGSFSLTAVWERDSRKVNFYTTSELSAMAEWDRQWRADQDEYRDRVAYYNRQQYRDPLYDPARDRNREIEAFEARRDSALRPAHEAAAARAQRYVTVRMEIACPAELAALIDRPKMLQARKVAILIQGKSVDVGLPARELSLPPVINLVRGILLDVDPLYLLPVDAETPDDK